MLDRDATVTEKAGFSPFVTNCRSFAADRGREGGQCSGTMRGRRGEECADNMNPTHTVIITLTSCVMIEVHRVKLASPSQPPPG